MADLYNQEKFNNVLSFFLGVLLVLFLMKLINYNQIIVIENIK